MVNIAKLANKTFSHVDCNLVGRYAKTQPKAFEIDMAKALKVREPYADKFERLASETNATKEKYPISELPELKAQKAPLWKTILGKIFG